MDRMDIVNIASFLPYPNEVHHIYFSFFLIQTRLLCPVITVLESSWTNIDPFYSIDQINSIMAVNITSIKASSNGVWEGDNPLDYAFPLLILQTTLILVLSRLLAFLFKPLRQPKVIAEIVVCHLLFARYWCPVW